MKKPVWLTVVGITGILFGFLGILGAIQSLIVPKMVEMQKAMMPEMQEALVKQGMESKQAIEIMQKMWDMPQWLSTWSIVSGIISGLISVFFIYASVSLLKMKLSGVKTFYWVAGAGISFDIIKAIVALLAKYFVTYSIVVEASLGVIINIILLVVTVNGNKKSFLD